MERDEEGTVMIDDRLSNDSSDEESQSQRLSYSKRRKLQKPPVKNVSKVMNELLNSEKTDDDVILSKYSKRKFTNETSDSENDIKNKRSEAKEKMEKKLVLHHMGRTFPDVTKDYEKEKKLRIIATQGVIQFFTTLNKYKVDVQGQLAEAKTTSQKEKMMSEKGLDSFLNLLDSERERIKKKPKVVGVLKSEEEIKEEEEPVSTRWSALAENYYQEPSLSGWDKADSDDGCHDIKVIN